MNHQFSQNKLRAIAGNFDDADIIRRRMSGISAHYSNRSIVVMEEISGIVNLVSSQGSILIGDRVCGTSKITAYKDVIIKGRISGTVKITAQTGNIYLNGKVSGICQLNAPQGSVIDIV